MGKRLQMVMIMMVMGIILTGAFLFILNSPLDHNEHKPGDKIATLSPIFVLDGDMEIYNVFSTGPFFYRIGDFLSEIQLAEFKGISSRMLHVFLDKNQPRAFLLGHEPSLEWAFEQYARRNGYKKINRDFFGLSLFVR